MIKRMLKTRTARKFFRNRLAVVALLIIGGYLALAVAVGVFGLISADDCFARVGPEQLPGFFWQQSAEDRADNCEFVLSSIEGMLAGANPETVLAEYRLGQLQLVPRTTDETRQLVEQGWALYDQLAASPDLNEDTSLLPQIAELEAKVESFFKPLSGVSRWKRNSELLLGTDRQGRSIAVRALYSIDIAIRIGLVVAFCSVLIGSLMGAAAAYYGGWVDNLVTWIFTVFSSIPNLVLLVLLVSLFRGTPAEGTLIPMFMAFGITYWVGPCRVIRGETLKLKHLEYIEAAKSMGFSRPYIMIKHILPNTVHLMLINFSLLFIAAIKGEVILTYLGLGIKNSTSWGIMISQSASEVSSGFFWQIGAATAFMFLLVLAFNILSDALQDAFDPKHV